MPRLVRVLAVVAAMLFVAVASRADDECPDVCPKCPSAKTIAEQVTEDLAAQPRPTVVKCRKPKLARNGGFVAHCLVAFPLEGTPPLAVSE